jgi:hypothetical protein
VQAPPGREGKVGRAFDGSKPEGRGSREMVGQTRGVGVMDASGGRRRCARAPGARSVGADAGEGIGAIKHIGSRRPDVLDGLSISGPARGATGARKRGSRGF